VQSGGPAYFVFIYSVLSNLCLTECWSMSEWTIKPDCYRRQRAIIVNISCMCFIFLIKKVCC